MNNTETLIFLIINDLDKYSRPKETLMPMYIEERLNKCLQSFSDEVQKSINNLSYKESRRLLKEELDE